MYYICRKIYWTDEFSSPRIGVSGMDGKNIRTFVSENLGWPVSVAIDYPSERLYWADTKLKIIESIRLNGLDRRVSACFFFFIILKSYYILKYFKIKYQDSVNL